MRPHRPRRTAPALAAAALGLALVLGGCSGSGSGGASRPSSIADVSVTGAGADQAPELEVPIGFSVDATARRVVRAGRGAVVAEGDVVGAQYVLVNGTTGERMASSAWQDPPTSLVMDRTSLPGLRTALVGQKVGSEVLVAVAPGDGYSRAAGTPPQTKVGPDDTLVFLVRLISAVPPRAQGTVVTPTAGLPTVSLGPDGEPSITVPPTDPPGELVVQQLIRGPGETVREGQTVRVQYRGVKWSDGTTFDSSWDAGSPVPFVVGRGQLIDGWDVGLVGQPVGSQVLLVVPPAEGYGDAGNPEADISGTDTLVFVIDVLAAS